MGVPPFAILRPAHRQVNESRNSVRVNWNLMFVGAPGASDELRWRINGDGVALAGPEEKKTETQAEQPPRDEADGGKP